MNIIIQKALFVRQVTMRARVISWKRAPHRVTQFLVSLRLAVKMNAGYHYPTVFFRPTRGPVNPVYLVDNDRRLMVLSDSPGLCLGVRSKEQLPVGARSASCYSGHHGILHEESCLWSSDVQHPWSPICWSS
jgi:hypothetical protein